MLFTLVSPRVRESKSDLDSGSHAVDFGFQLLDPGSSSVELGFRIPFISGIPDFLSCIPDSKAQDSGFHKQSFLVLPQLPTNGRNSPQHCWPTMLGVVASMLAAVCKRMQQLPTTCNDMQQDVQTDATCNIQQGCVRLHGALHEGTCITNFSHLRSTWIIILKKPPVRQTTKLSERQK